MEIFEETFLYKEIISTEYFCTKKIPNDRSLPVPNVNAYIFLSRSEKKVISENDFLVVLREKSFFTMNILTISVKPMHN